MIRSICIAALLIGGCASKPPIVIDAACYSFAPIYPSRQDTDGTKQQVLVHNRTYETLCKEKQ